MNENKEKRKKEFLLKIYVSWIKNKLTLVYGYITILDQKKNNKYFEERDLEFIKGTIYSIDEFIRFFDSNILKIHYTLLEYNDLKNEEIYKLIRRFWINLLPDFINKLKKFRRTLEDCIKRGKIEIKGIEKIMRIANNVNSLFTEIKKKIKRELGENLINQIDQKKKNLIIG